MTSVGTVSVKITPVFDEEAMKALVDEIVARVRTAVRAETASVQSGSAVARVEAMLERVKAGEFGANPGPGLMVTLVRGAIAGSSL